LKSVSKTVKKGGLLVLTTPSGKMHRLETELFGHIRHFDRDKLAKEVEGFGFKILRKTNGGFPMLNLERWLASLFLDRVKKSLSADFEQTKFFKLANIVIGCGMKISSKKHGCQLVIVGERI